MDFGAKGCMYCDGECNKECLIKQETIENDDTWSLEEAKEFFDMISKLKFNEVNESLKDISDRVYKESLKNGKQLTYEDGFKLAVTAMFFKMYSEEDVKIKLYECLGHFAHKHNIIINGDEIEEWFNNVKKK